MTVTISREYCRAAIGISMTMSSSYVLDDHDLQQGACKRVCTLTSDTPPIAVTVENFEPERWRAIARARTVKGRSCTILSGLE